MQTAQQPSCHLEPSPRWLRDQSTEPSCLLSQHPPQLTARRPWLSLVTTISTKPASSFCFPCCHQQHSNVSILIMCHNCIQQLGPREIPFIHHTAPARCSSPQTAELENRVPHFFPPEAVLTLHFPAPPTGNRKALQQMGTEMFPFSPEGPD